LVKGLADNAPIVALHHVSKWFPAPDGGPPVVAVKELDLVIPDEEAGEFVALLGPSGCGKSTVLSMISGLTRPDEGEVRVFGNPVDGPSGYSVTVPQAYTCFPWLTALGNVEFGLSIQGRPPQEQRTIAAAYLQKVGLSDRLDAYPKQLSGGMQQRVAIARTLAMKPPIVLMDEPFGALDAQTRSDMQQMLLHLWADEKNLILFVTHDISEALLLADRVVLFSPSPGRVIFDDRVPFPRPRDPSLTLDTGFLQLSQRLLLLLKKPPATEEGGAR
jgi:NitT/TauT family transport system ATP-binding protein